MQPQYFNGGGQRITPMAPAATYSSQDSSLGAEHPGNFTAMSHDMTAKTTSPNPLPAGYGASMVGVNPAPPLGLSMMGMPGPFSIASPAIFDGQGAMLAPAERQNYPKPADPMSTASRNSRVESQNSSSRSYSSNIYVASLPENFSDADLMNLAAPYGEIISAKAMCRRGTKICKGYGFVLFKHEEDAAKAQAALMGQIVGGNKIQVRRARVSASAPLMESSVIKPDTSRSTMSGNSSIASGAAVMVNANDIPYGLQAVAPPANTMGGAPPGTCCYMPMQSPSMPLGMWPAPAPQSFVEDPRVQPQPQPVMYFMVPMPNPAL